MNFYEDKDAVPPKVAINESIELAKITEEKIQEGL